MPRRASRAPSQRTSRSRRDFFASRETDRRPESLRMRSSVSASQPSSCRRVSGSVPWLKSLGLNGRLGRDACDVSRREPGRARPGQARPERRLQWARLYPLGHRGAPVVDGTDAVRSDKNVVLRVPALERDAVQLQVGRGEVYQGKALPFGEATRHRGEDSTQDQPHRPWSPAVHARSRWPCTTPETQMQCKRPVSGVRAAAVKKGDGHGRQSGGGEAPRGCRGERRQGCGSSVTTPARV